MAYGTIHEALLISPHTPGPPGLGLAGGETLLIPSTRSRRCSMRLHVAPHALGAARVMRGQGCMG